VETEPQLPEWLLEAPLFGDRFEAGRELARELVGSGLEECVVVGLARGGVQVAAEAARALAVPLDVLAVRKVGHPWQPEYALGAVTPGDGLYVRSNDGLSDEEMDAVVGRARSAADELDRRLHATLPPLELAGRPVVLVDDGLATGATMIAALRWARSGGATETIAAVPVAALESASIVSCESTRFVCPHSFADFMAVGIYYRHFPQVDDDEVVRLLAEAASRQLDRR